MGKTTIGKTKAEILNEKAKRRSFRLRWLSVLATDKIHSQEVLIKAILKKKV